MSKSTRKSQAETSLLRDMALIDTFAASAGDTITSEEALAAIRGICRSRLVKPTKSRKSR